MTEVTERIIKTSELITPQLTHDEMVDRIAELEAENKRRGDYILHILAKQNVVIGLNHQDKDWLRKLGIDVPTDEEV